MDGWEKFGQEASEMGLGRRLLRMPFCGDQGLQGLGLHQAVVWCCSKGVGEEAQVCSVAKCLCGTPHGGGLVHVLMLAHSAKGVVKVNV